MSRSTTPTFFRDAEFVLAGLRVPLRELVEVGETGERLAIHPTLRSRLLRGLETDHVATCLLHLPGPEGLRKAVEAGGRGGASLDLIGRCLEQVEAYERFLREEGISREMLHAMATEQSPEAHRTMVRNAGQSVFKAMSGLLGFSAQAQVVAAFFVPGEREGRVTMAMVRGFERLRRWRSDAMFPVSGYGRAEGAVHAVTTLSGGAVDEGVGSTLLGEYCSRPLAKFTALEGSGRRGYRLVQGEIGNRSATTFYFGERVADAYPQLGAGGRDGASFVTDSVIAATPSRLLQFDLFVHRDVWAGATARLETYRTVPHGPVHEGNIGQRDDDRIDLGVSMESTSGTAMVRRSSPVGGYAGLVGHALSALGHEASEFMAHRVSVTYPLHGTQYMVVFGG